MPSRIFIAAAFAIASVFLTGFAATAALPTKLQGPDVIQLKPTEVSLQPSGQVFVIVFVSAKCPCSDSHISELKTLAKEFPKVTWVGVHSNADEPKELTQNYFKNAGLPFPVLQDAKSYWADEFKALKTPHAYVLNQKGEILYQGGVSNSHDFAKADRRFLREALQDISEGKAVRTPQGRTLGCVIPRDEKYVW